MTLRTHQIAVQAESPVGPQPPIAISSGVVSIAPVKTATSIDALMIDLTLRSSQIVGRPRPLPAPIMDRIVQKSTANNEAGKAARWTRT